MHSPCPSAAQPILDAGRGITSRDTESGELLLDLVEHADVVEYLCFINSYSDRRAAGPCCRAAVVVVQGCRLQRWRGSALLQAADGPGDASLCGIP
jgi:hypothetical protein